VQGLFGERDVRASRDALQAATDRITNTLYRDWAEGSPQEQVNALLQAAETATQAAQIAARLAGDARYDAGLLTANLPAQSRPSPSEDAAERLFEDLRAWRFDCARKEGLSPYIVAYDRTLRVIARERPTTIPALEGMQGMGPAKAKKYGPAILDIIKRVAS
jgi:superfamily II DNA helicase RecQ